MLQGLEDYIAGVGRKIEGLGREEVRREMKVTRKKERREDEETEGGGGRMRKEGEKRGEVK